MYKKQIKKSPKLHSLSLLLNNDLRGVNDELTSFNDHLTSLNDELTSLND